MGECALLPPLLGSSTRLLNADHHKVYFKGMPRWHDGRVRIGFSVLLLTSSVIRELLTWI